MTLGAAFHVVATEMCDLFESGHEPVKVGEKVARFGEHLPMETVIKAGVTEVPAVRVRPPWTPDESKMKQ